MTAAPVNSTAAPSWQHWLHWAPRVIAILFIAAVGIIRGMDALRLGYALAPTLAALLMFLTPAGIVLVALLVAWRWPLTGGLVLVALGILYLGDTWGRIDWSVSLLFSLPLILAGLLFIADFWVQRRQ